MASVKELLIAARAKIEKPENWTTGWYAKTATGRQCNTDDPEAICFCSMGAIDAAAGIDVYLAQRAYYELQLVLERIIYPGFGIAEFNDTHTHAQVLDMFDKAIANAH